MRLKPSVETFNPFPGLRSFLPEDRHLFFGRDSESGEVLKRLLKNKFVTIIGASGCGKTSLVNCGVVPELISISEKADSTLKVISFRPGNDPIGNMRNAFAKTVSGRESVESEDRTIISDLKGDHNWIAQAVKELFINPAEKVLLVVDQFEDLFSHSFTETGLTGCKDVSEFVALLENAITQTSVDIYIVIVLRSGFIEECAHYHTFNQLINNSNYLLPHLAGETYRKVIEGPLQSAGAKIETELIENIIADIGDRKDQLPFLQHCMSRVWNHWKENGNTDRPVGKIDYESVGTISKALSIHADEIYEKLDTSDRKICEILFKAVTEKSPDSRWRCHPSSVKVIGSVAGCPIKELLEVIRKFSIPSIYLLIDRNESYPDNNSVIDISSSGLIAKWDRLKEWVDDEAVSAQIYLKLSETSAMYQKGKTGLLRQPDLQLAINWRDHYRPTLSWAYRYNPAFERAMVFLRTSEKEYIDEGTINFRKKLARSKRRRITAMILGMTAVLSLGLIGFTYVQKVGSDRQRLNAEAQKTEAVEKAILSEQNALLAGRKSAIADSNAAVALRKENDAEKLKEISDIKRSNAERDAANARNQQYMAVRQSDSALKAVRIAEMNARILAEQKNAAIRSRMVSVGKSMALKSLQLSGQKELQTLLAYQAYIFNKSNGGSSNDADIYSGLYNMAKLYGNTNYKTFTGHEAEIKSIAFIPGKREFFTSGSDGKVFKWDLDGKNQNLQVVYSGTEIINVLAVSPDAGWLAMGGQNSGIKVIPLKDKNSSYELSGHSDIVKSLIFSYDGRYLYSSALDGKVLKWDLSTRNAIDISSGLMQATSIDLSSDNKYIAGVSKDGKAIVWNPETTSDNFRIESSGKVISTVRFKPDENKLAIGYSDGYVELWDIASRKKLSEFKAHNSEVNNISFNCKLSQLATAGNDKAIRLWDLNDITSLPVEFGDNNGFVVAIDFSPDGEVMISGTSEGKNNLLGRPTYADILAKDLCTKVTRNFTVNEWQAYVGKDIEYEKTCPVSDYKIRINPIK